MVAFLPHVLPLLLVGIARAAPLLVANLPSVLFELIRRDSRSSNRAPNAVRACLTLTASAIFRA